MIIKMIWPFFLYGLFFGSGPCLASCGPILISYISGSGKNISQAMRSYLAFSLGRVLAYIFFSLAIFGLGNYAASRLLGEYFLPLRILGGSFVVLAGLLIIFDKAGGLFLIPAKAAFARRLLDFIKDGLLKNDLKALFFFGLITGLMPCSPLLALFSYIGFSQADWLSAGACGLFFGIGTTVSALMILALAAGALSPLIVKTKLVNLFYRICGLILLVLGVRLAIGGV